MKFSSRHERKLWLLASLVVLAIVVSLFINRELISFFEDQNIQAIIFVLVMVLIGIALMINAIRTKPTIPEIALWLGIAAVYIMLFLRLGLAERSHLMEYSILAMLVHRALIERRNNGRRITNPAFVAFGISFGIGLLDECIQLFLPHRVFDWYDIVFNGIVVAGALLLLVVFQWIRKRKTSGN
ncbi:MAG: VanZ family protein [Flavobacteriaceae bacterium]|nr:VanZ family protein [Flavobacteriaceae bacterium]